MFVFSILKKICVERKLKLFFHLQLIILKLIKWKLIYSKYENNASKLENEL